MRRWIDGRTQKRHARIGPNGRRAWRRNRSSGGLVHDPRRRALTRAARGTARAATTDGRAKVRWHSHGRVVRGGRGVKRQAVAQRRYAPAFRRVMGRSRVPAPPAPAVGASLWLRANVLDGWRGWRVPSQLEPDSQAGRRRFESGRPLGPTLGPIRRGPHRCRRRSRSRICCARGRDPRPLARCHCRDPSTDYRTIDAILLSNPGACSASPRPPTGARMLWRVLCRLWRAALTIRGVPHETGFRCS
jgi:hypothetical protein